MEPLNENELNQLLRKWEAPCRAAGFTAADTPTAKVAAVVVVEGLDPHSGSGRHCSGRIDCALDSLFAARQPAACD